MTEVVTTLRLKYNTNFYAASRDSNGIIVLHPEDCSRLKCARRRGDYNRLKLQSAEVPSLYDQIDFLRSCILPANVLHDTFHVSREESSTTLDRSIESELEKLNQLTNEHNQVLALLLEVQSVIARYQLGPTDSLSLSLRGLSNLFSDPRILLRAFEPGISHTLYSKELGFQSSGHRASTRAESIQALDDSRALSDASLRNHCKDNRRPLNWIFLTSSAEWLLDKCPLCRELYKEGDRRSVAFINVEKLRRINVLYYRSDTLAIQADIPRYPSSSIRRVKFKSPQHWLAYDWVPLQCIELVIPLQRFKDLYKDWKHKGSIFAYPPEKMLADLVLSKDIEELATTLGHQALNTSSNYS